MYTTFVAWVYGVTFISLIGYVGWMVSRLRQLEHLRHPEDLRHSEQPQQEKRT